MRLPEPDDAPPVGADGAPAAPPPLPSAVEAAAAAAAADGPLVRLALKEWSVEYDELHAVVWASTEAADYRLLSADAQYGPTFAALRRKTAVAARCIALLAENGALTLKQLTKHVVGLNAAPSAGEKLRADEVGEHAAFVAEQLSLIHI